MKKNIELSIIVIVYETEINLLKRCINSLLQLQINYEIVVVNDGSKIAEVNNYCENLKQKNIKYIYKENGGPSSARNIGLNNSSGNYIIFVDSDDYVDFNNIDFIDILKSEKDMYLLNYFVDNGETNNIKVNKTLSNDFSKNMMNAFFGNYTLYKEYAIGAVWNKIFSKKFLDSYKIRFKNNIRMGEDIIFLLGCLFYSPQIEYRDISYYYYYINSESACHKKNENLINYYYQYLNGMKECLKRLKNKNKIDENESKVFYNNCVYYCLWETLRINSFNKNDKMTFKLRKKEANIIYDQFMDKMNFDINKVEYYSKKDTIKLFLLKNKMFFSLYLYFSIFK